jgi:DNA processing protein
MSLSEAQRLDWLRLSRSENVGPVTFRRLIDRFKSAGAALEALPTLARSGGAKAAPRICTREEAEREIAALAGMGARLVAMSDPDYPAALAAIDDAPPLIAVGRNVHLLAKPCVAIVGARNASLNGRKLAETLARDLSEAGYTIVSGLARGIDTSAHQASLGPGTVAVVAGGIDVVYPPENAELQKAIFESGAIVSEMPCGMQPTQRLFPRRNRVIAGLSMGVLVVEASLNSGSLITANLALEQGREVFAVPGSPLDPRCSGTNNLIRSGAHLTERAEDVLNILRDTSPVMREPASLFQGAAQSDIDESALGKVRLAVLERLSPSPTEVDELVRDCQVPSALVTTVLLELELAGRLERQPGNRVALLQDQPV